MQKNNPIFAETGELLNKEAMIKKELKKIKSIYKDLDLKRKKNAESLMNSAAFMAVSMMELEHMYWLPQRVLDEYENSGRRQGRDNAPYTLWKEQGLLRTVDTYKVNKKVILDWYLEIQEKEDIYMMAIGYDPWHIDDSLLREFEAAFGKSAMIPIRQGVATLSQPMKELKADLSAKKVVYDNNPIDKMCLANTAVRTDINGNIQPVKTDDPRKRIDGTMALVDGYVVLRDKFDEYISLI